MYYETIKWVQGLEGAKSYQLMPTTTITKRNERCSKIPKSNSIL